jgi:hypothetical protein
MSSQWQRQPCPRACRIVVRARPAPAQSRTKAMTGTHAMVDHPFIAPRHLDHYPPPCAQIAHNHLFSFWHCHIAGTAPASTRCIAPSWLAGDLPPPLTSGAAGPAASPGSPSRPARRRHHLKTCSPGRSAQITSSIPRAGSSTLPPHSRAITGMTSSEKSCICSSISLAAKPPSSNQPRKQKSS